MFTPENLMPSDVPYTAATISDAIMRGTGCVKLTEKQIKPNTAVVVLDDRIHDEYKEYELPIRPYIRTFEPVMRNRIAMMSEIGPSSLKDKPPEELAGILFTLVGNGLAMEGPCQDKAVDILLCTLFHHQETFENGTDQTFLFVYVEINHEGKFNISPRYFDIKAATVH